MQIIIEIPDENDAAIFVSDMLQYQDIGYLRTPTYESPLRARLVNSGEQVEKMVAAFRAIDFNSPENPYTNGDVINKILDAIR